MHQNNKYFNEGSHYVTGIHVRMNFRCEAHVTAGEYYACFKITPTQQELQTSKRDATERCFSDLAVISALGQNELNDLQCLENYISLFDNSKQPNIDRSSDHR